MLRFVPILLAIFGVVGTSRASVLTLDSEVMQQAVPSLEVFPAQPGDDAGVPARLAEAQGRSVASGHFIDRAYRKVWMRLVLRNSSPSDLERLIYLPNNFAVSSLDFYSFRDAELLDHRSYNRELVSPGDGILDRTGSYVFTVPGSSSLTVYIKAHTGYKPLHQSFFIGTRQEVVNSEMQSVFFVGMFLGILLLTAVGNVMQAAAYRDRTFFWYSAYCLSLLFSSLSFYGIWVRMFSMWEVQKYTAYIGTSLVLATGSLFIRPLMNTRRLSPRLDAGLRTVCWLAWLTLLMRLHPFTDDAGDALRSFTSILFIVFACCAGVNAIVHGLELAWLYTSSLLFIALTVIYLQLSQLGIVPVSPNAYFAPAIGHVVQVILLSYVVFIRSRRAHSEMLRSQRNHSMNERLNLLLKIISHDIANPLQAISLYCNMALHKLKSGGTPDRELARAMEAVHTQTRIIRHAKEAVRQMQLGQKMQIQAVHVSQILHEVLQIFQPLCQDRGIRLEVQNELREDLVFHTDPTILVHNILGNILSNSIKFTPEGGLIQIRVRCLNRRMIFDLVDNGPGISKEKRLEIFTLNEGKGGKEHLTGAGSFGLSILQMCSELLNGQLDIGPSTVTESGQELGLRITVFLPLHHAL